MVLVFTYSQALWAISGPSSASGSASSTGGSVLNTNNIAVPQIVDYRFVGEGSERALRLKLSNIVFAQPYQSGDKPVDCNDFLRLPNINDVALVVESTGEVFMAYSKSSRSHLTDPVSCEDHNQGWLFDVYPEEGSFPNSSFALEIYWFSLMDVIPDIEEDDLYFYLFIMQDDGIHIGNSIDSNSDSNELSAVSESSLAGASASCRISQSGSKPESGFLLLLIAFVLGVSFRINFGAKE